VNGVWGAPCGRPGRRRGCRCRPRGDQRSGPPAPRPQTPPAPRARGEGAPAQGRQRRPAARARAHTGASSQRLPLNPPATHARKCARVRTPPATRQQGPCRTQARAHARKRRTVTHRQHRVLKLPLRQVRERLQSPGPPGPGAGRVGRRGRGGRTWGEICEMMAAASSSPPRCDGGSGWQRFATVGRGECARARASGAAASSPRAAAARRGLGERCGRGGTDGAEGGGNRLRTVDHGDAGPEAAVHGLVVELRLVVDREALP
jgi:hypothetical protein